MFRCTITEIVPIDGQHAVANTQLSITCCQAALQQVENIDAMLLWPPHELNAQLFIWSAFIQDHMDAVIPQGMVGYAMRWVGPGDVVAVCVAMRVAVPMRAVALVLLSEHG